MCIYTVNAVWHTSDLILYIIVVKISHMRPKARAANVPTAAAEDAEAIQERGLDPQLLAMDYTYMKCIHAI